MQIILPKTHESETAPSDVLPPPYHISCSIDRDMYEYNTFKTDIAAYLTQTLTTNSLTPLLKNNFIFVGDEKKKEAPYPPPSPLNSPLNHLPSRNPARRRAALRPSSRC